MQDVSQGGHHFNFRLAAIAAIAIVVAGFSQSYYLKTWFGTPELPWLLHLHGAIMTSWFILFLTQTYFVSIHRVRWHRRLGVVGVLLAILVVVVGASVVFHGAAREVQAQSNNAPFFVALLGFNLVTLTIFACVIAIAIAFRRLPALHKRLMLLATFSILGPAFDRIPIEFIQSDHGHAVLLVDACILAFLAIDTLRHRRLYPALAWGSFIIIALFHLTIRAVGTQAWMRIGTQWVS